MAVMIDHAIMIIFDGNDSEVQSLFIDKSSTGVIRDKYGVY